MEAIAVWRNGPWEEHTSLQLPLASAAHAFGNQGPFIFGDRSPDLQEQMGLRVLSQRLIEKLDLAPRLCALFQHYDFAKGRRACCCEA